MRSGAPPPAASAGTLRLPIGISEPSNMLLPTGKYAVTEESAAPLPGFSLSPTNVTTCPALRWPEP